MSARVDADLQSAGTAGASLVQPAAITGPAALAYDPDDRYGENGLPSDHPKWMKDTLSLSQRARALLGTLQPVAVRVFSYWEHRVRSIALGAGTLSVDLSGSYRLD